MVDVTCVPVDFCGQLAYISSFAFVNPSRENPNPFLYNNVIFDVATPQDDWLFAVKFHEFFIEQQKIRGEVMANVTRVQAQEREEFQRNYTAALEKEKETVEFVSALENENETAVEFFESPEFVSALEKEKEMVERVFAAMKVEEESKDKPSDLSVVRKDIGRRTRDKQRQDRWQRVLAAKKQAARFERQQIELEEKRAKEEERIKEEEKAKIEKAEKEQREQERRDLEKVAELEKLAERSKEEKKRKRALRRNNCARLKQERKREIKEKTKEADFALTTSGTIWKVKKDENGSTLYVPLGQPKGSILLFNVFFNLFFCCRSL
jgi:hypothetical protein